jgi:hypothetical protein
MDSQLCQSEKRSQPSFPIQMDGIWVAQRRVAHLPVQSPLPGKSVPHAGADPGATAGRLAHLSAIQLPLQQSHFFMGPTSEQAQPA